MEKGKRNTTTTITRRTRNLAAMADSVKDTRLKMGRPKAVRPTAANNVTDAQLRKRKTENTNANPNLNAVNPTASLNQSCDSDSTESNYSNDQKSLHQVTDSKVKIASEHIKVLKKSRSEPIEGSESSESELRKVKSDNWNHNDEAAQSCKIEAYLNDFDLNRDEQQINDQQNDSIQLQDLTIDEEEDEFEREIQQKTEQELTVAEANSCDEETEVVSSKDEIMIETSSDQLDSATGIEDEDEGKQNKNTSNDHVDRVTGVEDDDEDEDEDEAEQNKNSVDNASRDADQTRDDMENRSKGVRSPPTAKSNANLPKSTSATKPTTRITGVEDEDEDENEAEAEQNKKSVDNANRDAGQTRDDMENTSKRVRRRPTAKSNANLPKSTSATKPTTAPPTTTTSACHEPPASRSIHRTTPKSPKSPTMARTVSKQYNASTTPETNSKLQSLVDLVLWKDVSKTAFIFGFGTFIIISSSYTKDFNFSLISVTSYMSLVYLAIVFLYKSFMKREVMDREDRPENYVWGEEEAIWFVKLILPYLNEFLLKLREIFSGDPAMTMKVAVMLFVLARCGSCITLWKTIKLGFFGVFVVPKLCSSYSAQIIAYGNFWVGRFRDAWESCSHKKALAFAVFTLVWNFSSVIARAWAAFMLFVAFRYYQQSLFTQDFMEEQTQSHNANAQHIRHLARNRHRVPTSLDQRKQKKSF